MVQNKVISHFAPSCIGKMNIQFSKKNTKMNYLPDNASRRGGVNDI